MQLTRQADYAIRAVLYLAERTTVARVTTAEVGRAQHIPLTFLTKIMAQLSAAGLVQATRGSHGGIALARPASEVSLLDIVEAIEGPVQLNACVTDPSACPMGTSCQVHSVWCDAQADLVNRLRTTTFAGLVQPPAPTTLTLAA
jgi:Rrf2 family protein